MARTAESTKGEFDGRIQINRGAAIRAGGKQTWHNTKVSGSESRTIWIFESLIEKQGCSSQSRYAKVHFKGFSRSEIFMIFLRKLSMAFCTISPFGSVSSARMLTV